MGTIQHHGVKAFFAAMKAGCACDRCKAGRARRAHHHGIGCTCAPCWDSAQRSIDPATLFADAPRLTTREWIATLPAAVAS